MTAAQLSSAATAVLMDTSILLRRTDAASLRHVGTVAALERLSEQGRQPVIARQNGVEFRGVVSRPVAVNGLGMSSAQADAELDVIEGLFPYVPEPSAEQVQAVWRDLCRRAGVSGKQVHDTRLVAVCVVAGVQTVLTWNPDGFRRFVPFVPGLTVLTPADVLSRPTS